MKEYAVVFDKTANVWSAYAPDLPGLGVAAATIEETEKLLRADRLAVGVSAMGVASRVARRRAHGGGDDWAFASEAGDGLRADGLRRGRGRVGLFLKIGGWVCVGVETPTYRLLGSLAQRTRN